MEENTNARENRSMAGPIRGGEVNAAPPYSGARRIASWVTIASLPRFDEEALNRPVVELGDAGESAGRFLKIAACDVAEAIAREKFANEFPGKHRFRAAIPGE